MASGPELLHRSFAAATVSGLRHELTAAVRAAGLSRSVATDFVLAVHELVTNAVLHGGGAGDLWLRRVDDVLVCEVVDYGTSGAELPVRLAEPHETGGRGLWLAHRLTGTLLLTRRPDGVTATVSVCLTDAPAAPRSATSADESPGPTSPTGQGS